MPQNCQFLCEFFNHTKKKRNENKWQYFCNLFWVLIGAGIAFFRLHSHTEWKPQSHRSMINASIESMIDQSQNTPIMFQHKYLFFARIMMRRSLNLTQTILSYSILCKKRDVQKTYQKYSIYFVKKEGGNNENPNLLGLNNSHEHGKQLEKGLKRNENKRNVERESYFYEN